jgi:Rps23 Pro-64 3,4-dihydroxylase Tpa1-like proline 4-hydroxylase
VRVFDLEHWDVSALAARYRAAKPFCHVVIDDVCEREALRALREAFEEEPAHNLQDEIFDLMASAQAPEHATITGLVTELASAPVRAAVEGVTGARTSAVEARIYAYLAGHYLLPHADLDEAGRRRVAFVLYVDALDGLRGGELDLFACTVERGAIVGTEVAASITPRPNRLVLFEVTERSLHQVREVTAGIRLSLAGWFLA